MATINLQSGLTTQADIFRRIHEGELVELSDVRAVANPIMATAHWKEAISVDYDRVQRVVKRQAGSYTRENEGVAREKMSFSTVDEQMAMFEGECAVDERILERYGANAQRALMEELAYYTIGMSDTLANDIFYGNAATDPKTFTGFASRMGTLDAKLVVDGGGTGQDVTSIYFIGWGDRGCSLIYPKGLPNMGIQQIDRGVHQILDASSNPFYAVCNTLRIRLGIAVANPLAMARYANIETSGTTNTFNEDKLIDILNYVKSRNVPGIRWAAYCNETIFSQIEKRSKDKGNAAWGEVQKTLGGFEFTEYRGIPFHLVSSELLINTETAITT